MKRSPDKEVQEWLENLGAGPDSFDWDEGNMLKNLKHGVSDADIESVFRGVFAFAGRIIEPAHPEWRGMICGRDSHGRGLILIFTVRGEKLRPISCRPMRPKERSEYEKATEGKGRN